MMTPVKSVKYVPGELIYRRAKQAAVPRFLVEKSRFSADIEFFASHICHQVSPDHKPGMAGFVPAEMVLRAGLTRYGNVKGFPYPAGDSAPGVADLGGHWAVLL